MTTKKSNVKKRNWGFFVYPTKEQLQALGSNSDYDGWDGYGTAPDDWIEQLKLSGLQFAISPLHDKDKHEDGSGRTKKPHFHVIVVYGSPTTFNNVKRLTDKFNAPIPQDLEQVRGYYRYLTHKDSPDKFQYDEKDIITGGGFNIADFVEITKSEVNQIKFELLNLIREKRLCEYKEFMDYIQDNMDKIYFDIASSHTIFFNTYLKSARYSGAYTNLKVTDDGRYVEVDTETGEILEDNAKGGQDND